MFKWITIILLLSVALFAASYFIVLPSGGFTVGKQELNNDLNPDQNAESTSAESAFPEISIANIVKAGLAGSIKLKGSSVGQTNVLFLGAPGKGWPGANLTDTMIVGIINYEPLSVKAVSIPRDFAYKTDSGAFVKLNSIYANNLRRGSLQALKATATAIEDITGLRIHYYAKVDLNVVTEVVERLDGVNVQVPQGIYDPEFPGPNYSYETFEVDRGWRYLDAKQAAKFIRTRHTKYGDFSRMKRQKLLLAAIRLKIENMDLFHQFSTALSLWRSLKDHVTTDFKLEELRSLFKLAKDIDLSKAESYQLDVRGEDALLTETQMDFGETRAYVVVPKAGVDDYSEIHKFFEEL